MRSRLFALVLGLVTLAAACGNAPTESGQGSGGGSGGSAPPGSVSTADLTKNVPVDAPGVTDDTIKVGGVASVTNPLGGKYGDAFVGAKAYLDMVNEAGGIYGRKIELVAERDDQVVNNQTEVQGLISQDEVFAILPVATLVFSGASLAADEGVPTFGWIINPEWAGPDNFYGEKGTYICFTCGYPTQPWLAKQLGRTKVGVLGYGVSDQSKECVEGVKKAYENYPVAEVVFEDAAVPFGTTDLSVQVSKMKEAGVDLITTCMDTNGVTTLAKEVRKQELDAVQYMQNSYDQDFVAEYGDLFEGSYVAVQTWPFEFDPKPEGMQQYAAAMEKAGGEVNENSLAGWLNAELFYEGLAAAGPEFSRQKVVDAINTFTAWNGDGATVPWNWTTAHTQDPERNCYAFLEVTGGRFEPRFTEPGKPFVCFDLTADQVPENPERSA